MNYKMKFFLSIIALFFLSGCSVSSKQVIRPSINAYNNSDKEYIMKLNKEVEEDLITEKIAGEKLKNYLRNKNNNLNNGSVELILEKLRHINPKSAAEFEKRIRKNHPEEFLN